MKQIRLFFVPILVAFGFLIAGILSFNHLDATSARVLQATLFLGSIPLVYQFVKSILKGQYGVDIIALVAIVTSFLLHEYIAGSVIVLMLSGGEALEAYAARRSTQELTKLLSLAPSIAHRKNGDQLTDVPVEEMKVGEHLVVKPGEVVPIDGVVVEGKGYVDESSITGESEPVLKEHGQIIFSGSVNKTAVLEIRATHVSSESQYQRIVALVKNAQEQRAPIMRLADRYAVGFSVMTFTIAIAAWIFSNDPSRFLAVLVVATPCPLILAVPIAIISAMSRAASRGIVVKNGRALEILGEARGFVFDKTGTLTLGEPILQSIVSLSDISEKEIIRIAASIDQLSLHLFARALVQFATENQIAFSFPESFSEVIGSGVEGVIDTQTYFFGKLAHIKSSGVTVSADEENAHDASQQEGVISVYLSTKEKLIGKVLFEDRIRPEIKQMFEEIKEHKIKQVYMLTGDRAAVAHRIAEELHIKHVKADMKPEDKLNEIRSLRERLHPIVMVGDGINDAPAMAAADVSIALAAYGSSASSEAGDIVIVVNNMLRVHDILHIAQRAIQIAKQSIYVGIGVSLLLMIIASMGYIPPVLGAVLQEVLDVAVILNALRVSFEDIS
ncbi:MAG: heavy metal translocating P-type ATPase [Candidatus Uhrbacteria bacterium]|nr:heavy metal translocating P-type ATPase [Candidatus Uhrbacteria bacterium]